MANTRDRFKGATWFTPEGETAPSIIIGGAGGIGSWLALFLKRAGFSIYIFDDDIIESHNLGGQFFRNRQVGVSKVSALKSNIHDYTGNFINIYTEKYVKESFVAPFMMSAFDNMAARKLMFEKWYAYAVENLDENPLFIDGRLEMEQLQIFCVTVDTADEYRKHLFDDGDVEELACTTKQTSHSAGMIASLMTAFFTNHISNIYTKGSDRIVPFFHEYYIPLNLTT